MAKVSRIEDHLWSPQSRVFFDTNLWIDLRGPLASLDDSYEPYREAFAEAARRRARIFVHPVVIGEYTNRCARKRHEQWQGDDDGRAATDFKNFRKSRDWEGVAKETADNVKNLLLKGRSWCDRPLSKPDLDKLIDTFREGSYDISDLMIGRLCERDGLVLVTHDRDFAKFADLEVLTANDRWCSRI